MSGIPRLKGLLALAASMAVLLVSGGARADALSINFESYAVGTINGQDGWSSLGAAGSGCAVYDHAVVDNTGASYSFPSFGTKSLRMSNAVTSGCFGDQTFSKSLANEAGETDASNGGLSGGTRQRLFDAQWDFASTVPGAEQPGLSVVASPDRGDGARMSWVQMADTPGGLEINFFEYRKGGASVGYIPDAPDAIPDSLGCDGNNFLLRNVATGLDRSVPHTIRVIMVLLDGPANDFVVIFIDGLPRMVGTSWEDFFRDCQPELGSGSRTVDSILFRTGGAPAPATLGNGFVIDNLTVRSAVPDLPL